MTLNRISVALLGLCLAGCPNDVKLAPLPAAPVILTFTASAGTVAKGAKVTLSWNTTDAPTVELNNVGVGLVTGVDNKPSGTVDVTIDAQTLFVLSAVNKRGVKTTALVTVGLDGGSTRAFFAGLPELVAPGGAVTLVWSAPAAKVVTLTPMGGAALDLKGQLETGSVQVPLTTTTTFTLDADGTQKQVTIAVAQAAVELTVSKALAQPAEMVTVSWKTTGASKVTLSSPGRGALVTETDPAKMAMGSFVDTLPNSGLGTIVPYVLTVAGSAADQTASAQVVLSDAPQIKTFTAPEYVLVGKKFSLAWTTTSATLVEVSTGGVVIWSSTSVGQATAGSVLLSSPSAPTDYTLTARGALGGAPATKQVSVKPVGTTSVTTFTALPGTVAAGGGAVTLTWNVPNARRLRILGSDGHTVATSRGVPAETGTATAYPNGAITYTLDADNTLEAPVTATAAVTVTAPAAFGPTASGPVFAGNPVDLAWTVGTATQLGGFPHSDVVNVSGSTGFVDISATGTKLTFAAAADDATLTFTPPDYETFLYGNRLSGPVTVSTNGFLVFGASAASRPTTTAIPNATIERNFIAPYWTNLELGTTGNVFWQVTGEAPDRVLVVQFDKLKIKGDAMSEITLEAKLHQTGVVTFEYKKLAATAALPAAVIGVQGVTSGLPAGGAATNVGITLFGPKSSPLTVTFNQLGTLGGFLRLANGYLKVGYTPPSLVLPGDVGISEVLYQPNAAIAATGEWFEVTNATNAPLDLNGWVIDFGGGVTHTIASPVVVPSKSAVVLGQSASGAANDNVATAYQYGALAMSEPAGALTLRNVNYQATVSWNSALLNNGGAGISINVDTQPFLLSTDVAATAPHPISCSSATAFGAQTPNQQGTPGAIKACFGYLMRPIPVSYLDISATGTAILTVNPDESAGPIDLSSAPVPYFGVSKSQVTASTNGWLSFLATTSSAAGNRTLPSTGATNAGTLAIFWDDLDAVAANGAIYQRRVGAGVDPANPLPHWIIQWSHYSYWISSDDLNFQVKLFDSGIIEYHYAAMTSGSSSNYGTGVGATVWLEKTGGGSALVSSINQPKVAPNTALRFTPN